MRKYLSILAQMKRIVNNCAPLQGWKNVLSTSPGQVVFLDGQVTFIAQLTNGQESGKSFSNKIIN